MLNLLTNKKETRFTQTTLNMKFSTCSTKKIEQEVGGLGISMTIQSVTHHLKRWPHKEAQKSQTSPEFPAESRALSQTTLLKSLWGEAPHPHILTWKSSGFQPSLVHSYINRASAAPFSLPGLVLNSTVYSSYNKHIKTSLSVHDMSYIKKLLWFTYVPIHLLKQFHYYS